MIHPTSIIEDGAQIGQNVKIGPFCYIKSCVTIEDNCELVSHVVLGSEPQSTEYVDPTGRVIIGKGSVLREFVTIHRPCRALTQIGKNCFLMAVTHVAHDCIVGDHVTIVNCSGLSGYCRVGNGTVISGLCHIHQHAVIGRYCMIGSSTLFKGTSPDGLVWVMSNKIASPLKINAVGLDRHNPPDRDAIETQAVEFLRNYAANN